MDNTKNIEKARVFLKENPSCAEMIRTYLKNDLSLNRTAKELSYHRNTIDYWFSQIEKASGLSPKHFYDAVELDRILKGK